MSIEISYICSIGVEATKGLPMAEKVTKRQQAVLDCIEECIREKGYGPTVREVCHIKTIL